MQVFGQDFTPPVPDRIPASMAALPAYAEKLSGAQSGGQADMPPVTDQSKREAEKLQQPEATLPNGKKITFQAASAAEVPASGKTAEPGSEENPNVCDSGAADSWEPAEGALLPVRIVRNSAFLKAQTGMKAPVKQAPSAESLGAGDQEPCAPVDSKGASRSHAGVSGQTWASIAEPDGETPIERQLDLDLRAAEPPERAQQSVAESVDQKASKALKALLGMYAASKPEELDTPEATKGAATQESVQQECSQASGAPCHGLADSAEDAGRKEVNADKKGPVTGVEEPQKSAATAAEVSSLGDRLRDRLWR